MSACINVNKVKNEEDVKVAGRAKITATEQPSSSSED